MGRVYLKKVYALRKYENKNIIRILGYIAKKKGLIQNNKIMYRKLYTKIIKPWCIENCRHKISYKQYNRLRKHNSGNVPKYAAEFLYELYQIMVSFNKPACLGESKNDVTYSNYTMFNEKWRITEVIDTYDEDLYNESIYNEETLAEFEDFINSLIELDDKISNNGNDKIYNNIW